MLARGPAPEIVVRYEYPRFSIGRLVEDEIRVLAAIVAVALFGKQSAPQPGPFDRLEVLLWNDHVGVDIDHPQRRCDAFDGGEFFHGGCLSAFVGAGLKPAP